MMRSMLADQPNLEVTSAQGESVRRVETDTFSTRSPSAALMKSVTSFSAVAASSAAALSAGSVSRPSLDTSTCLFVLGV
jgi:hypothetical protein